MGWIDFYNFDKVERIAIFIEIASQKGRNPFAAEKD
jgi:hypothetical protein